LENDTWQEYYWHFSSNWTFLKLFDSLKGQSPSIISSSETIHG